jgi:hypothetical protein
LEKNVSIIYLLATEVNAVITKRLHGLAHGRASKVVIFQTMEQIPITPLANSFLVIPDSEAQYLTCPQAKMWSKIFLLTMDPNRLTGFERIIFLNSCSEIGVVWQKVVLPLKNMGQQPPEGRSWHAIEFSGSCKLSSLVDELSQNKRFYGALGLSSVQPLLLALTNAPADISNTPLTFKISLDANSLKIDATVDDKDKNLLLHFIKIAINGSYDAQLWHHTNAINFSACINFHTSGNTHACLIDVTDAPCLANGATLEDAS